MLASLANMLEPFPNLLGHPVYIFNIKSYPETTTTKSMMFHRFRM